MMTNEIKVMIVSICGCAGTGKTTVSRLLAKRLKFKLIKLDDVAKKKKFFIGYDEKRKSAIVSVSRLKKEVTQLTKKYHNVVLEGLYAHEFPADFVIVLRCDPEILVHRLKKKYQWPTKIVENTEAEMIGLIAEEAIDYNKNVFEVDTSKKTVAQSVKTIEDILKNKNSKYAAGKINWLK